MVGEVVSYVQSLARLAARTCTHTHARSVRNAQTEFASESRKLFHRQPADVQHHETVHTMPSSYATMALTASAALAVAVLPIGVSAECPTVKPVDKLDFSEWVRKTWFIQQQQITEYQPLEDNYCVLATYGDEEKHVPAFDGTVIAVHNYANQGEVNGPNENAKNQTLCARRPHNDSTALLVAPCFLPNAFAGDYWVVAVGDDGNTTAPKYTWAVVSGGSPTVQYDDGCTTKTTSINESGLWIFTRDSVGKPEDVAAAREALKGLGYTLSQLHNITHEGCKYDGAKLK